LKRGGDPDDERLWAVVTATVRPLAGRAPPAPPRPKPASAAPPAKPEKAIRPGHPATRAAAPLARPGPEAIEPGWRRRLTSGREPLSARIDLHGLDQDGARAALTDFILRGAGAGVRTVLVITGKGALGDGVLRRRVPEWLGAAPLRSLVGGLSEAHRRHGGGGALYVTLKRRERG